MVNVPSNRWEGAVSLKAYLNIYNSYLKRSSHSLVNNENIACRALRLG